jgi:hypothetical protein
MSVRTNRLMFNISRPVNDWSKDFTCAAIRYVPLELSKTVAVKNDTCSQSPVLTNRKCKLCMIFLDSQNNLSIKQ